MNTHPSSARRLALAVVLPTAFFVIALFVRGATVSAGSLTFSGTVLTPGGGAYADGGWANLGNASGGWGSGIDGSGRFEISGFEPGTYSLDISLPASSSFANPAQQSVTVTTNVTNFTVRVANPVLTGTLAIPDGTPTSGCVNVRNASYTVNRGSCPGSDGKFKIGALDAGGYIVEISPPDPSPYVGTETAVTVTNPGSTLDLGILKLENPFIVGTVALPDGSAVPWSSDWNQRIHLSVDFWNSDNTINKHSGYDADSKFKFGRVPAGTYTLHVNVWDTELYTGSVNVSVTVPAGGLDLTASPVRLSTPQLSGTLFRPDGTTPVQNAWLTLHNDDWTQNQGSNTDVFGKYRIGGLPAGTYILEVNPPSDLNDVVRPDPVSVTVGLSNTTRNITLSVAKKFVSGTVRRTDGSAVVCAQVNANLRGGNGWANARTKSDGTFSLTLQPGSWNVRVERDYGFDCPDPDWIFLNPEAVIEFSADATEQRETVNFTVQKATAVIAGKVRRKDGTPVTQGNVNASSQTQDGRNRWSNAQIKADGSYKLLLTAGTYDLNVWTNDSRLFAKNQKVAVAENQAVTANFTMSEKLAHITGTVTTKAGVPLGNIQINGNLDCGPQGCSAWGNTTTDSSGAFDFAATTGRWNLNFDSGRGANYVYDGPPVDVYVPSETATVSGVNFALTYADVVVKGKIVDENGKPFADFPGWAYVRPATVVAGVGQREYGGPVNQGTFNFRVPSTLFRQAELGVHVPPNSAYSPAAGQTVTLVADATIELNITVRKNDAAIVGRILDTSGLPLKSCSFRGEVFANAQSGQWHGTQINPDCTYEISLLAGTYDLGYHIEESAGFLNRPPANSRVTVTSGTRLERNLTVLAGDAQANVLVLNPDGTPARRVWVWADNHEEIDRQVRGAQSGGGEGFRGPGGTTSPEDLLKYCKDPKNEKECRDFKLPPGAKGPGGCTNALQCTQYCQSHAKECKDAFEGKTATATKVSNSVRRRQARVAGLRLVRVKGESTVGTPDDPFRNQIGSGGETNDLGVARLSLLSGHEYTVNAGLPPESAFMPPKSASVNLLKTKSADLTLALRTSDGRMTGFVTWNGVAVTTGFVSCWSEDGNSSGSPVIGGGYALNYTFDSTYHCEANAFDGVRFLRSDEQVITIGRSAKTRKNFTLGVAGFEIPPPVSESFDAASPHVMTLADGTTLNIPANTLASSGTVTVTADPTINIQSQSTAKPLGYGYAFEARDSDNKPISTFAGNVTVSFKYTDAQLTEAGIDEGSLVPSYWDATSRTWKKPPNITQDTENNTITVTTNHFSAFAVVSTSGKGRNRALTSVTTRKKSGRTQVVVGTGTSKRTFTPFPNYRGAVAVGTTNVGGKLGQVIAAVQSGASSDATTLKLYNLKGKLLRKELPGGSGYRAGVRLLVEDLTRDNRDDLIAVPNLGTAVTVHEVTKRRQYRIPTGGGNARVTAAALDLLDRGDKQLATRASGVLRTWKFSGSKFDRLAYDTVRRLAVRGDAIERVRLTPSVSSVTPTTLTAGKGTAALTVYGANLGDGSRVLVGGTAAKSVKARGERTLTVTVDRSKLKRNKRYDLTVVNSDGVQLTLPGRIRTKK